MPNNSDSDTQDGHTLLETILCLSIVTLSLGIAASQTAPMLKQNEIQRVAREIKSILSIQRIRAVGLGSSLTATLQNRKVTFLSVPPHSIKNTPQTIRFPAPVRACKTKVLHLWHRGSSSVESFCIKQGDHRCKIIVALRGRIRVRCEE